MTMLQALADHLQRRDLREALLAAPPAPVEVDEAGSGDGEVDVDGAAS